MPSPQQMITPRHYFASLEAVIEDCYAKRSEKLVIYLEGGHYNKNFGADEFATNTLLDAIGFGRKLIVKYQKNIKLVYGVLVDDLGMACSDESCIITPKENIRTQRIVDILPDEIEEIIQANSLIKRDKLMIFSERTSKNRAIESIKKKLKVDSQGLSVTDVAGYSEINVAIKDALPFMLAKKQGSVFTAKCPAIIFQHYKDVCLRLRQRFAEARDFVIIDWSDLSDQTKVMQGGLALTVMQEPQPYQLTLANVFFGDDEGHIVKIESRDAQVADVQGMFV